MPVTERATKSLPRGLRRARVHREDGSQMRLETDGLPPGVCGRIVVTALTFNATDTYGTQFAPGCADRSISQRVQGGKLPLLRDHDNAIEAHVGVVRAMPVVGDAYLAECDILDNPWGRAYLEYAKSCIAAGAVTGASIRFVPRAWENLKMADGSVVERFTEIELRELTVVPLSSVPNTDLLVARKDGDAGTDGDGGDGDGAGADGTGVDTSRDDASLLETAARAALDAMAADARAALLKSYTETAAPAPARDDAATPPTPAVLMATDEARLLAVRQLS